MQGAQVPSLVRDLEIPHARVEILSGAANTGTAKLIKTLENKNKTFVTTKKMLLQIFLNVFGAHTVIYSSRLEELLILD